MLEYSDAAREKAWAVYHRAVASRCRACIREAAQILAESYRPKR